MYTNVTFHLTLCVSFFRQKKSNKSKCQVGAAAREGLDGVKGAVEVGMWIIQTLASNGRFHLKDPRKTFM